MKKTLEKKDVNRNSFVFFIIGITMMFIFSIFDIGGCEQQVIDDYNKFNQANISGVLRKQTLSAGRVFIQLNEVKEKYAFWPINKLDDDFIPFYHIAQPGDSIIKPAFTNKIILISNGKKYSYRFEQYHTSFN